MGCSTTCVLGLALVTGCGRFGFDDHRPSVDAPGRAGSDAPIADVPGDQPAGMPFARVQTGPVVQGTDGVVPTLSSPSTPGTLLVAALVTNGVNPIGMPSASWVLIAHVGNSGGCYAEIAYLANNPGGITSATFTQGLGIPTVAQLGEWSGVTALDASGTAISNNPVASQQVTATTTNTAAPTTAVTSFCEDVNMPTYTPGSGWLVAGSLSNNSSSPSFETDYRMDLVAGSLADEIVTSSVNGKFGAVVATFR